MPKSGNGKSVMVMLAGCKMSVTKDELLDSAEFSVSLVCPTCNGTGEIRNPIEAIRESLAEFPSGDIEQFFTKCGQEIMRGIRNVDQVTCTNCKGEKRIKGHLPLRSLLESVL